MCLSSFLITIGVIALVGGGAGYLIANGKLNDASYLWKKFGSEEYQNYVTLKDVGTYAIIIGILMIIVGVVLYAVYASQKKNQNVAPRVTYIQQPTVQPTAQTATRVCSYCGKALPADGKFCPNCGGECGGENEVARRQCSCGTVLEEDMAFCPNCGRKYQG